MRRHALKAIVLGGLASVSVAPPAPAGTCAPDFDADGQVRTTDFLALFAHWGTCPGCIWDVNGDGQVDHFDLLLLLDCFGPCPCPALGNDEVFNEALVVDATNQAAADLGLLVTHVYATGPTVVAGDKLLAVGQANLAPFGSTFYQHPNGSATPPDPIFCGLLPGLCYDTFVTMGVLTQPASANPLLGFIINTASINGWWNSSEPQDLAVDIGNVTGHPGDAGVLIAQVTLSRTPGQSLLGYGGTVRLFNGTVGSGGGGGGGGEGTVVPVSFFAPNETPAAGEVGIQAVGDFNGDRFTDVIAVIPGGAAAGIPGAVQVFLNQGTDLDGQWQGLAAQPPINVGLAPSGIAVGLFNMDAFPDVAVGNAGDDSVSILINQATGDGTFLAQVTIAMVGDGPSSVVADDFTEDVFTDLAIALEFDQAVAILVGDGNGGFTPLGALGGIGGLSFSPVSLLSGDFDGNKCPDLSGAGPGISAAPAPGQVFVALGQGGGAFGAPVIYPVGPNPLDLASENFNNDAFPDIATADNGGTLSILVNDGTGLFPTLVTVPVGQSPESVDAVDLSGDGRPDLAVTAVDPLIGPAIQVLINLSMGQAPSFGPPIAFPVGADPNFVVGADFDNDGQADLVTGNTDDGKTGGSVTVIIVPPPPPLPQVCFWDCGDQDGSVGVVDFLALLAQWGANGPCDFDGGGAGVVDFLALLANWGACP